MWQFRDDGVGYRFPPGPALGVGKCSKQGFTEMRHGEFRDAQVERFLPFETI